MVIINMLGVSWCVPLVVAQEVAVGASASVDPNAILSRTVTVDVDHVSLESALRTIAANAGVRVQYAAEQLEAYSTPVTLHVKQVSLGNALAQVLVGTPFTVAPKSGGRVFILENGHAENVRTLGIIQGKVLDAKSHQAIAGASVLLDSASKGILTRDDGSFRIAGVVVGTHTLSVKHIGYAKAVKAVTATDDAVVVADVMLTTSTNQLAQVVVTGTVTPTELKAVPNAITVITAKQLEERGITHIDQLFRGDVPGLFAQNNGSSNFDGTVTMFSRGATTLPGGMSLGAFHGTNPIKTYLDGVELADPSNLNQIDPKSIERIEILTGPQASTIYGSNAINGVMQIFTKRGTATRPEFTLAFLNGWIQNNFSSATTPQHDYTAQVNGAEGRMSYNGGGSWSYVGPWSPSTQSNRYSGFGGVHLAMPTPGGSVTTDVSVRRTSTLNVARGDETRQITQLQQEGLWYRAPDTGAPFLGENTLRDQTMGLTLNYVPISWWSHEIVIGQDASDVESISTGKTYRYSGDTLLFLQENHNERRSLRYTTTAQVLAGAPVNGTVTLGGDGWQTLATGFFANPSTLSGNFYRNTSVSRDTDHNRGAFVQAQVGVLDQFFVTYGLRAEWNPSFGANVRPNYAPRFGAVYTKDLSGVTFKIRGAYGRSTRPPMQGVKDSVMETDPSQIAIFGPHKVQLANPDLLPEHQQGGEGGLELYFGNRASLVVTRYNQTVDDLIFYASTVDSVQRLDKNPDPYGYCVTYPPDCGDGAYYRQGEVVNLGSVRNQGWELQSSVVLGPFTTKGTYSWTNSRVLGVLPKYRHLFSPPSSYPDQQPGASFYFLPEHTWALNVTYAVAGSMIGVNVNGIGQIVNEGTMLSLLHFYGSRLMQNNWNMQPSNYHSMNPGYITSDLNASHHIASRVEGVLQIQNLTNHYANDFRADYAVMGRQTQLGFRVRL